MIKVLIPARGGSKRIAKKNLLPLGGKSLLELCIEKAHLCQLEVWVSSEDSVIKEKSKLSGAKIHHRKLQHAEDFSPVIDTCLDFLEQMKDCTLLVLLQCTSPFTQVHHIQQGIEAVEKKDYKSAVAVYPEKHHYWKQNEKGVGIPSYDIINKPRTQDLEANYRETGGFYVLDAAQFRIEKRFPTFPTFLVEVDFKSSLDIDEVYQYDLAKQWYDK